MVGEITIYDNFNQVLNDFDIVAVASKGTLDDIIIGVYFNYGIFVLDNFDILNSKDMNYRVTFKRPAIYTHVFDCRPLNRQSIELGDYEGECKIVTIIKIEQPNEDMLMLRATIIDCLDKGKINSNVSRNILKLAIDSARESGRL